MRSRYGKVCPTLRRQLFLLLATFSVGFLVVTSAHAAIYYVATNGSDSNPGSKAAPFRSIARGSKAIASGDTLYVRAGTYGEQMIGIFKNGTPGAYTRYAAYPGEERKVIVKPHNNSQAVFVVWFSRESAYIELSGMVFDAINFGRESGGGAVMKLDGSPKQNKYPHNIRVINNELRNSPDSTFYGGGGGNEIIGNDIHHSNAYGIYTGSGPGSLIEGNRIHDSAGYGLHLYQQEHRVNGWVVRNNVFYGNGRDYTKSDGRRVKNPAVILTRGQNQFYNNIIYDNHAGISVIYGASNMLVANNTVYGNDEYGINVGSSSRNAQIINNIVWGNGDKQITDTGTNTSLQNNLTTDPIFENAAGRDFGVKAGSPAIDKGKTLAEVKDDFTGKKRPEGAAYDIGAYEGAGPKGELPPSMGGGLPPGAGGGPVLRGPNGEVCYSGYN